MGCSHVIIWAVRDPKASRSKYPMVLQEVLFQPLLCWMSDALVAAGASSYCLIRDDPSLDDVLISCLPPEASEITVLDVAAPGLLSDVMQFISECMGDAIFVTRPALLTASAVDALLSAHKSGQKVLTELLTNDECRTGVYCLVSSDADKVFPFLTNDFDFAPACLEMQKAGLPLGEFFVSDGIGGAVCIPDAFALQLVRHALQVSINDRHMAQGVSILDPASAFIGPDVKIGRDTTILPGVLLSGSIVIGEDCVIGPNSVITNSTIGDDSTVAASHMTDCEVGSRTRIGPFAYLRPGCRIGDDIKIGDFVEVKNSTVGNASKIPHLSYIGDSDVGSNVNVGCGSITVNYDGREKHRTTIEDGAFIGCNTNLVAPVRVGAHAYTAAGSTVTDAVPADALAISRVRQQNKEEWALRRRDREKAGI